MFRLTCCVLLLAVAFVAETTADAEGLEKCRDPNAVIGCKPDYCGDVCFQAPNPRAPCPREGSCASGGCHCATGYKFDANALKCVEEKDCTRPVAVPIDGALN